MKTKYLLGLIYSLSLSINVIAANGIYTDDVVVSATRTATPRESLIADVSVVTQEEIRESGAMSLSEILRRQSSIEIQSNGGLGQVSAIHLRGNSSQSAVVLLDGIRIGSATVGFAAFERIPLEQIERIEIVRGATSSLYGSDAIGGVIQIFTNKSSIKPNLHLYAGYGSYNTRENSAAFSNKIGQTSFSVNLSTIESDGFSTLRKNDGVNDDKDSYRNLTFSGNLSHQITLGHDIGISYFNSNNNLGFDDDKFFKAKIRSNQTTFSLFSNNQINEYWLSRLRIGESIDGVRSNGSYSGLSIAKTYQRQYTWQNDFKLPAGTISLGLERIEQRVDGNPSNTSYSKDSRDNNGYFAIYSINQSEQSLQASARRDYNSQFGPYSTGSLAYGYQFHPQWRAFGSIGTAFRAPTFNDLYWPFQNFGPCIPPYDNTVPECTYTGNPNLVPEKSRNKEISIVYDNGHHRLASTFFHNQIRDLIIPAQGLFDDFPLNAGEATIKGLNISYEGWVDNFHIKTSADLQSPRNDESGNLLPRRSQRYGALGLGYRYGSWNLLSEVIGSSERYDDVANTRRLHGYALLNLSAHYRINQEISLQIKANNILDKEYALSTQFGSPFNTPGANLFVGLRYSPDINTGE